MRTCSWCEKTKILEEFTKNNQSKSGRSNLCKKCNRAKSRAYIKTPSGIYTIFKSRQVYVERHKNNKERCQGYPSNPKPVTISRESFIAWYNSQDRICSYCGLEEKRLDEINDAFNSRTTRLSIDCKDNNLGYAEGNLVLACSRCNAIKCDFFTYDEMLKIGRQYVTPKWLEKTK